MITSDSARGRWSRCSERGVSTSVQYAVLTPVLMLVIFGIISTGVWLHGRNVAVQAAELAADEARGTGADLTAARAAAGRVAAVGGLDGMTVTISRGPATVDVLVTAPAPSFFELPLPRIEQRASAPVERVTRR